jgi:phage tail sheath protein FI
MAEKIVSPGVFTNEVDQSFLPAGVAAIGAAVIGPTAKGPANVPTTVSSYSEFVQLFGGKFESGSGASKNSYKYLTNYAAQEYLKYADTLTVVRPMHSDAAVATSIISSSTTIGSAVASGSLTIGSNFAAEDEVQITVGETEYRFIAADPVGGIPVDSSPIFYFATGSTLALGIASLVTEIDNAAIGVDATATVTALQLTASSAGTSGNSITVDTGSGTTFSDVLTLAGGTNTTTAANCFTLETLSYGADQNSESTLGTNSLLPNGSENNIRWEVSNVNNTKGTFQLSIRRGDDTSNRKKIVEQYSNVTLDPNSSNYIAKVIGDQKATIAGIGSSDPYIQYSGDYANRSKYVRVTVHQKTLNYLDENGTIRDNALSSSLPAAANGAFANGSDGSVVHPMKFNEDISDDNIQGFNLSLTSDKNAYIDAIKLLKNQDEYDINVLSLPGLCDAAENHATVLTEAVGMVEDRGDCFLVMDPVLYGETSIPNVTAKAEGRDSNYVAEYWPWIKIPDNELGRNVWVPASTVIPSVYAFNDRVAAPWFAPAGLNRGGIDIAIQAERKLTHANRDTLYDSNVNPIATFPNAGVTVFGQKTLQKKASALDRVNVRRLLIAAKKFIASSTKFLVFENNTAATRNRFLSIVNPYFESIQQRQGLYAFKVVMDGTNNTADVIDRNEMRGQIFMQPAKTAEFIVVDFNILPTGASFPE